MFKIEKKSSNKHPVVLNISSIVIAVIAAGVVIALCGYNPVVVYREMIAGSLGGAYYIQETIQTAIPLIIMGLGVAVCFKMSFINIGAEGQFCMGAVAATYIALNSNMSTPVNWFLMFLCAFLAGGAWCLIAGLLKAKWGVSETLVTLMLNYVALKLVSYLQNVLWKDPKAFGFPKIANYPKELQLPDIFGVNVGIIFAIILMVFVSFLLNNTKLGFEISIMGQNSKTARYAGINTAKVLILASIIGGGISGIAGVIQASGVQHTLNENISGGMGFTAIAIAYMAKMRPRNILIASLLFSILIQGGNYMQISMQIPAATADVVQGIILLFVLGSEFFTKYKFVSTKNNKEVA